MVAAVNHRALGRVETQIENHLENALACAKTFDVGDCSTHLIDAQLACEKFGYLSNYKNRIQEIGMYVGVPIFFFDE